MTTYSTSLKLELPGDGQQTGTWGQTTNKNLGDLLEQAITGVQTITMIDTDYTLTNLNGTLDEARNAVLKITGTLTAQRDVIAPIQEKLYTIYNATTGGFAIRIIGASGTGVVIPNGMAAQVYFDGTNYVPLFNGVPTNFVVYGNLGVTGTTILDGALTYGGTTLSNSVTGTGSMALSASPIFTGTPIAPTAPIGTSTTQIATTAFVQTTLPSGVIVMWSGSIASIPSGWYLCNGSNGTPDLRDRFVVGAGSTYSVAATGGSKDAVVVSHTHTATSSVSDPGHQHLALDPNAGTYQNYGINNGSQAITAVYGNVANGTFQTGSASTGITVGTSISTTGSSGTNANLPPYYALAYIMKA